MSIENKNIDEEPTVPNGNNVQLTRESIDSNFSDIVTFIETEIERLRLIPQRPKGIQFLRGVKRRVKILQTQTRKIIKQKNKRKNKQQINTDIPRKLSGIQKPMFISKELALFTGWIEEEKKSRVDVTRFLGKYIRQNNLQNPNDKREIHVEKDERLQNLLNYNEIGKPFKFCTLQKYITQHLHNNKEILHE